MRDRFHPLAAMALAGVLLLGGDALSMQVEHSAAGVPYVSGGITDTESEIIASTRHRYALAVTAVSRISGGPLIDAHVRVSDASGKVVLDADMDGPWLLAGLQPGRYQLAVRFQDETQTQWIEVVTSGQIEVRLSFRSDPSVSLVHIR